MEITKFGPYKTGELVKISDFPGADFAFIPDPLPPVWVWPNQLWPLLLEAHKCLARLDGVGMHVPDPDLLLIPLQNSEALNSTSLERIYTTPEQLLLFQMDPNDPGLDKEQVNPSREADNYKHALRQHSDGSNKLSVSLKLARDLHRILLTEVRSEDKQPGEFRKTQNQIGKPARFVPPPPERVTACLDNLEKFLHGPSDYDPLVKAFLLHYQFEAIHPFVDDNGRVGRLLLALAVREWCSLSRPWLCMSAYFNANKDKYLDLLFKVSSEGGWSEWVAFCLEGVVQQAIDTERRCLALLDLSGEYRHRIQSIGRGLRLARIADSLFAQPIVRIPYISKMCSVTYPTAEADIEKLIKVGILQPMKDTKVKTYAAGEILKIAYS